MLLTSYSLIFPFACDILVVVDVVVVGGGGGGGGDGDRGRGRRRVNSQVLKCQLRDFVQRNPRYLSFLARRQGLVDRLAVRQIEAWHGQVVFWERAVGARLSETYR